MVLFGSNMRRMGKTDESLVDDRFPQHLSARKATDTNHKIVCMTATAFDQFGNAIPTQLTQRGVGRKAAGAPGPFGVPIHLVARVFIMCDVGGAMSHRS